MVVCPLLHVREHVCLANKQVYTDHSALKWLKDIKPEYTGRLARWSILLQCYEFEVVYKPGPKNEVADALSRRTYPEIATQDVEDVLPSSDIGSVHTSQNEASQQVTCIYSSNPPCLRDEVTQISDSMG